jgi:hypothetical protein
MERNFTNDENFEPFLRRNADNLRMRASDKVWKNISRNLNRRRRRMGMALGVFLLTCSLLTYYVITESGRVLLPAGKDQAQNKPAPARQQNPSETRNNNRTATTQDPASNPRTTIPAPVADQQDNTPLNDNRIAVINTTGRTNTQRTNKNTNGRTNTSAFNALTRQETSTSVPQDLVAITHPQVTASEFKPGVTDSHVPDSELQEKKETTEEKTEIKDEYPYTIESVVNSFKAQKKNKLSFQVFFTPTVSYRKLSENKSYLRSVEPGTLPPSLTPLYDVNNIVTHKPDIGFELGVAAKYPLTEKLKVRGGVQFNVNRYDIKAFNSHTEIATIALNNGNRGVQSVTAPTHYSNMNGYRTNWLQNFYFQVSAPVGVEYKLKGNDNMYFGVAGTIQPTYILGDRAYVISSDYKNYAEVPMLIRHWNVGTNFETFVSYSTGKLQWQVGPQVRYQLLSSFVSKYPVKENLFDFGLKVGVTINNNQ